MIYTPHDYQKYCEGKIIELPCLALWLEMGLGKTAVVLSAVQELKYSRFLVSKVLVIAPKKVAEATWQKEADKWDHNKKASVFYHTRKRRTARAGGELPRLIFM